MFFYQDDDDEEDEDDDNIGVGLHANSSKSRQDAAKAAQAVMTAAAVMMASKQTCKNKKSVNQSDIKSASSHIFKHSYKNGKTLLL